MSTVEHITEIMRRIVIGVIARQSDKHLSKAKWQIIWSRLTTPQDNSYFTKTLTAKKTTEVTSQTHPTLTPPEPVPKSPPTAQAAKYSHPIQVPICPFSAEHLAASSQPLCHFSPYYFCFSRTSVRHLLPARTHEHARRPISRACLLEPGTISVSRTEECKERTLTRRDAPHARPRLTIVCSRVSDMFVVS